MLLSGTYVTWMHEEIIAEYDAYSQCVHVADVCGVSRIVRFNLCDWKISSSASYELRFPAYLDGYELETEAKGYLSEVRLLVDDRVIEFAVYDEIRLGQEIADGVRSSGFYSSARLLVAQRANRREIAKSVNSLFLRFPPIPGSSR